MCWLPSKRFKVELHTRKKKVSYLYFIPAGVCTAIWCVTGVVVVCNSELFTDLEKCAERRIFFFSEKLINWRFQPNRESPTSQKLRDKEYSVVGGNQSKRSVNPD